VYANRQAIRDGFKLAGLKKGETVLDLGCGDARSLLIASKEFGAKGIGVEKSLYCYLLANLKVWIAGERKNVKILLGDFNRLEQYIPQADVIYLYLLNSVLAKKEDWIFGLISKKCRIVSLSFTFVKHKPLKSADTVSLGKETKVRLYKTAQKL